jgi:hypothetical protein
MRTLRFHPAIFAMIVLSFKSTTVFGQIEIPLKLVDGVDSTVLHFGMFPGADVCINPVDCLNGHCELFWGVGVPPCGCVGDSRFVAPPGRPTFCYDQGSPNDYRPRIGLVQRDTFRIYVYVRTSLVISWPSGLSTYFSSMTLRYFNGTTDVDINMLASTSANLTGVTGNGFVNIFTSIGSGVEIPLRISDGLNADTLYFGFVTGADICINTSDCFNSRCEIFYPPCPATGTFCVKIVAPPDRSIPCYDQGSHVDYRPFPSSTGRDTFRVYAQTDARPYPTVSWPNLASYFVGPVTLRYFSQDLNENVEVNMMTTNSVDLVGFGIGGTFSIFTGNSTLMIPSPLTFSAPTVSRCDNESGYVESILLPSYVAPDYDHHLKALQLWIVIPTNLLNNFGGLQRGSAIASPAWNFSYVIYEDNGTGEDTARIVIFGNGTNALGPSTTPRELVRFNYGTANINGPNQNTSLMLRNALGAARIGTDAGVTAGPDQVVTVVDRIYRGDVNDDDVLDILDLLMIVDHILNISPLAGSEFFRADIAPWPNGDGIVNVLDLALLQDIILNGLYPPGLECGGQTALSRPVIAAGGNGSDVDVKLSLYITNHGIAVRMKNVVAVKGLQLEFDNIPSVPTNLIINTYALGQGYSNNENDPLRLLIYDQAGGVVQPGDRLVANMPFPLANPEAITVGNVVVAGSNNQRIESVGIEIIHTHAPELPIEYALYQNYPNPFNPTTTISFAVPVTSDVKILIYDLLGKEVRLLYTGNVERGTYFVGWDGRDNAGAVAATGMYIYRMSAGTFFQSRKMILMK